MINETLNQSTELTFDTAYAITSQVPMIVALFLVWFIPLMIYLIWGCVASARTSDGRKLNSKVISNSNFWIGIVIFGLIGFALILLIIFPVWLLIFE